MLLKCFQCIYPDQTTWKSNVSKICQDEFQAEEPKRITKENINENYIVKFNFSDENLFLPFHNKALGLEGFPCWKNLKKQAWVLVGNKSNRTNFSL